MEKLNYIFTHILINPSGVTRHMTSQETTGRKDQLIDVLLVTNKLPTNVYITKRLSINHLTLI